MTERPIPGSPGEPSHSRRKDGENRPSFTITVVPAIDVVEWTNTRTGTTQGRETGRAVGTILQRMFAGRREGSYLVADLVSDTDPLLTDTQISRAARELGSFLPKKAFAYTSSLDPKTFSDTSTVAFGNIEITSREPTDDERAAKEARERREEASRLARAEALRRPREILLIENDHAIVTIGEKEYVISMSVERPDSFLAVRVLQKLSHSTIFLNMPFEPDELTRFIWNNMSHSEKLLFGSTKQATGLKSTPIKPRVAALLQTLRKPPLNVLDPGYILKKRPTVTVFAEPAEPTHLRGKGILFSIGTDMELVNEGLPRKAPSVERVAEAKLALQALDDLSVWTDQSREVIAYSMIALSRTEEGREALRIALAESDTPRPYVEVAILFDNLAESNLPPDRFEAAIRSYTISGNRAVQGREAARGRQTTTVSSGPGDIRRQPINYSKAWIVREPGQGAV